MRLLFWPLKLALFTLAILVLGHVVHFRGRTVSDQVKVQISSLQKFVSKKIGTD